MSDSQSEPTNREQAMSAPVDLYSYEVMDRIAMICEAIGNNLEDHPGVTPQIQTLLEEALDKLMAAYQEAANKCWGTQHADGCVG